MFLKDCEKREARFVCFSKRGKQNHHLHDTEGHKVWQQLDGKSRKPWKKKERKKCMHKQNMYVCILPSKKCQD